MAYVAKKKSLSAGVGLSAPSAPGPVLKPVATPVVEARVGGDAGRASMVSAPAVPVVEVLGDRGTAHPSKGSLPAEGVDLEIEDGDVSDEECSSQGQMGAGLLPTKAAMVDDPIASPMCQEDDLVDVGWTSVGKKGKKKKKAGQPGVAADHQQSDGEGLQGGAPIPGLAEDSGVPLVGSAYVSRRRWKGKGRRSFNGWCN